MTFKSLLLSLQLITYIGYFLIFSMCHNQFSVEDAVLNKTKSLLKYSLDFSDKNQ